MLTNVSQEAYLENQGARPCKVERHNCTKDDTTPIYEQNPGEPDKPGAWYRCSD